MSTQMDDPSCHDDAVLPAAVRVGAVSYLNSKPLLEGLEDRLPGSRLRLDVPSRLADELATGSLDVALVPSIALFRQPGLAVISDACVATHGAVLSVKVYFRVPPGQVRTMALDEGSRTSAALARILLRERYAVEPECRPLALELTAEDAETDAVLLIGDRAINPPPEQFVETWDLGEQWLAWTGLPFVFATWVARANAPLPGVAEALEAARDAGLARLDEIARREAPLLGLSEATTIPYLRENLHFRLGPAERSGLRLFQQLATQAGLAAEGVELVFRDPVHS